jgi:hypothetical protein
LASTPLRALRFYGLENFFQSLENGRKNIPIIGKNGRNFPTIGKFFSNHWKISVAADWLPVEGN